MSRLLAGAAAHNAGRYEVARAVWAGETPMHAEADAPAALLDALAAFGAAVTEGRRGEWAATREAVSDAALALDAVDDPSGVDLGPLRRWLDAVAADPETVERSPPPTLTVDGDRPRAGRLPLGAAAVVAGAVAAERGDDSETIADALRFAREADHPESTRYATFVRDYAAADAGSRGIVFRRLSDLVARERRKEEDVSDLFE